MKKLSFCLSLLLILPFWPKAFSAGSGTSETVNALSMSHKVDTSGTSHTVDTSGVKKPDQRSEKLALRVEEKYRSIKDLSMSFTKTLKSDIFETQKKAKGKMYLKNPDKFRIETKDEIIVTDGEFLWSYSEQNQQVIKSRLDKSKDIFKPNQYLSNFREEYKAELSGEEKIDKVDSFKLLLTPKEKDLFIIRMTVWIDKKDLLARKMEYTDMNDNQVILVFDHIKTDKGIHDSKFVFKAPEGVEEVDLTE
jgi:chaperone LolA